jgi:hypothetical protein
MILRQRCPLSGFDKNNALVIRFILDDADNAAKNKKIADKAMKDLKKRVLAASEATEGGIRLAKNDDEESYDIMLKFDKNIGKGSPNPDLPGYFLPPKYYNNPNAQLVFAPEGASQKTLSHEFLHAIAWGHLVEGSLSETTNISGQDYNDLVFAPLGKDQDINSAITYDTICYKAFNDYVLKKSIKDKDENKILKKTVEEFETLINLSFSIPDVLTLKRQFTRHQKNKESIGDFVTQFTKEEQDEFLFKKEGIKYTIGRHVFSAFQVFLSECKLGSEGIPEDTAKPDWCQNEGSEVAKEFTKLYNDLRLITYLLNPEAIIGIQPPNNGLMDSNVALIKSFNERFNAYRCSSYGQSLRSVGESLGNIQTIVDSLYKGIAESMDFPGIAKIALNHIYSDQEEAYDRISKKCREAMQYNIERGIVDVPEMNNIPAIAELLHNTLPKDNQANYAKDFEDYDMTDLLSLSREVQVSGLNKLSLDGLVISTLSIAIIMGYEIICKEGCNVSDELNGLIILAAEQVQ